VDTEKATEKVIKQSPKKIGDNLDFALRDPALKKVTTLLLK